MKGLYFLKWPLLIFLMGFLTRFIGVLFKIRHWPYADEMITYGSVIGGIGVLFAMIKLFFLKKPGDTE